MASQQQPADEPPPYSHGSDAIKPPSFPLPLPPAPAAQTANTAVYEPPLSLRQKSPVHHTPYKRDHSAIDSPPAESNSSSTTLQLPSLPAKTHSSDASSPTEAGSAMSMDDPPKRRDTSVSMDDPDDRMAAEALCGLGKVESARSPSGYEQPLKYYPVGFEHTRSNKSNEDAEPLLSLLTSSHPWLGGTINGSLSAYSSTKSHSPRFIRYGADFVERNIGSAMANTVGSVGRRTGVEGSLRRYLGARRASEVERQDASAQNDESATKRRRISDEEKVDGEHGIRATPVSPSIVRTMSEASSVDTLPVYDDNRSPAYEDSPSGRTPSHDRPAINRSWSTQLIISTSGLGAALNEASLRSLRYCLTMLRGANGHVRHLMDALKVVLRDYENSPHDLEEQGDGPKDHDAMAVDSQDHPAPAAAPAPKTSPQTLVDRIQHLNNEIWNTFKNVVNTVSRHTGGALPENASLVVRWQLMSVPQRWQRAVSRSEPPSGEQREDASSREAISSAHRMLAFAIEGLDMMDQVGGVVDSTILSAERWLESMGRRKKEDEAEGEEMKEAVEGAPSVEQPDEVAE